MFSAQNPSRGFWNLILFLCIGSMLQHTGRFSALALPLPLCTQQDRSTMAFKLPQFGSGKASTAAKKPAARTAAKPATVKKSGTVSTGTRKGGVGYRQAHGSNSASSRWMAPLQGQPD